MLINFNTFGTVAKFNTKCDCNYQKMPYKIKQILNYWNDAFERAKNDIDDVQCVFSSSQEGCHGFGLKGCSGCNFKHDEVMKLPKKWKHH